MSLYVVTTGPSQADVADCESHRDFHRHHQQQSLSTIYGGYVARETLPLNVRGHLAC